MAATRQLAKRQLTWLRKWGDIAWICVDNVGKIAESDEGFENIPGLSDEPFERVGNFLTRQSL